MAENPPTAVFTDINNPSGRDTIPDVPPAPRAKLAPTGDCKLEKRRVAYHFGQVCESVCNIVTNDIRYGPMSKDFLALKAKDPEAYNHYAGQMSLLLSMTRFVMEQSGEVYRNLDERPKAGNYAGKGKRVRDDDFCVVFKVKRPRTDAKPKSEGEEEEDESVITPKSNISVIGTSPYYNLVTSDWFEEEEEKETE